MNLNNDWIFTDQFSDSFMRETSIDNETERWVRVPHTCKETPYQSFSEEIYQMVCGYKRTIWIEEAWQGQRILLTFEGVGHETTVYINGVEVGAHHCGYTAFTLDITQQIVYGASNQVLVKVDTREQLNVPPFGHVIDYMTYGGIYREVYLEIKAPYYIEDVFVQTHQTDQAVKQLSIASTLNQLKDGLILE